MFVDAILFPSSFFNKNSVDEDLKKEYDAVIDCGKYKDIILFSYEDWFHKGRLRLNIIPEKRILAVYRGWMMKPEQYEMFYENLYKSNIELITVPAEYERFHVFPMIYPFIRNDTPETLVFSPGMKIDIEYVKSKLDRFMVKDYVKSVKGTDFPVSFNSSIAQEEFDRYMEQFRELRGSLLTGGICVKEFAELKKYNGQKNEYRVFYINGIAATVSRNSGQGNYTPAPPETLIQKYDDMGSPFYTIDYAELVNGEWVIIEVGDGSVSGLSDGQDYIEFFRKLHTYLRVGNSWLKYNQGKTLGENRPGIGIVLRDEELEGKARITLGHCKDYYSITCEVCGFMTHTASFNESEVMNAYKFMKEEIWNLHCMPRSKQYIKDFCDDFIKRY